MCGRYTLSETDKLKDYFVLDNNVYELKPSYNISPGRIMPVITNDSQRLVKLMKWGLVPSWAKDPKIGFNLINARAETINVKPSFKQSFLRRRCLIPASGFYEWTHDKYHQPYYFHLKDNNLFAFAGIYDQWQNHAEEKLDTYTIITTEANQVMKPVHDRMPVIITKENHDQWLLTQAEPDKLLPLLQPINDNLIDCYPVTKQVNSPKNDSINLLKNIEIN